MNINDAIHIHGVPDYLPASDQAIWRSRFDRLAREFLAKTDQNELNLMISTSPQVVSNHKTNPRQVADQPKASNDEQPKEERAVQYKARRPLYSFDFLIVSEQVRVRLLSAINLIKLEAKIFEDWNLKQIEPFPRSALNFHGDPGTGKTLAAHALADHLKRPIMVASYAQIESKFHGDGPKNVEAIFYAAERDGAVLFIDEADSLLSKRLTSVTQGSEQAINSMRSQLLICLEQFKGLVIFATNLVTNYDRAFETRIQHIHFELPDEDTRRKIWSVHLKFSGGPPLAGDVSIAELAKIDALCGRDIKNAVIGAALSAAQANRTFIAMKELVDSAQLIKDSRIQHDNTQTSQPLNITPIQPNG